MKYRISITAFDLNRLQNRVRIALGSVAAVVVTAAKVAGTWASVTLPVKRCVRGVGSLDFVEGGARSIAVGGAAAVVLHSAELEGCGEIEISTSGVEAGWLELAVEVETEGASPVILEGEGTVRAV